MPATQKPTAETGTKPRCAHFGDCGGCRLQDVPYAEQLERKKATLETLVQGAGWASPVTMHPSPEQWYYRNKMEFSFQDVYPKPAEGQDYLFLGLKQRNRWDRVMNLLECYLLSPEAPRLLEAVHRWALKEGLEPYNLHRHTGFLRHLVVREGKNTGERLVNAVTTAGRFPSASFVEAVLSVYPDATVVHSLNSGKSDTAAAEQSEVLRGPGHIHESVLGRRIRISPYSFFQTNTRGAEFLYGRLREWLEEIRPKNLLDLYCGCGGIGLTVADLCERVMGVEVVESSVADARLNAQLSGVGNADFMTAKTEDLLPGLAAQGIDVDAVIVDPPRCGLHPRATAALKDLAAPWLIYVSCNAKALAEDIRRLASVYDLKKVEGVDLFPQTDHCEAMALLQRIF